MGGSPVIKTTSRHVTTLVALIVILLTISPATAAEDPTYVSVLKFYGGMVAAFSIHEGGHALVGAMTDTDMDWEIGNYNQPLAFTENASNNTTGAAINSAGLLTQALGAEIILQDDRIDKNDDFVRGMMAWNILNPVLYAVDYWFIHSTNKENGNGYQGDLQGVEYYSDEPTAQGFAISMSLIAVYQGYRFLKIQSWAPDWLKNKSHSLSLSPLPRQRGLAVTYDYAF